MSEELQQEHRTMVTDLCKKGEDIVASLTPEKAHLWHMATGVSGEANELLEAIDLPLDMEHILEELGDGEFYLEGSRQALSINLTSVLVTIDRHHQEDSGLVYLREMVRELSIHTGLFLDLVKKHVVYNKELDIKAMTKCLGTVEFNLEGIRLSLAITRERTLQHNIHKLQKGDKARYKSGSYSDEQAQERSDKE